MSSAETRQDDAYNPKNAVDGCSRLRHILIWVLGVLKERDQDMNETSQLDQGHVAEETLA
jgi:hypothetical protein